ncbi:hypothetical protein J6590_053393 [Homalodisca vitripennis]|nr:hypothetical protein J6590_094438 [Homalodisca vitripennis]KAG8321080.1 hypothetical protein J6590_053393 [Homalodisca vitripennis]
MLVLHGYSFEDALAKMGIKTPPRDKDISTSRPSAPSVRGIEPLAERKVDVDLPPHEPPNHNALTSCVTVTDAKGSPPEVGTRGVERWEGVEKDGPLLVPPHHHIRASLAQMAIQWDQPLHNPNPMPLFPDQTFRHLNTMPLIIHSILSYLVPVTYTKSFTMPIHTGNTPPISSHSIHLLHHKVLDSLFKGRDFYCNTPQ